MKKVIWVGPEREIPGYCLAIPNEVLPNTIPKDMVESYVAQGLAKAITSKIATKEEL